MKLADFILSHDGDDLAALALARSRFAAELEADGGGLGGGSGGGSGAGLASGGGSSGGSSGGSGAGLGGGPSGGSGGSSGGGPSGGPGAGLASGRRAGEAAFDLALTTLEVRRKLRDKVPQWHAVPSLVYPLRISGEQCSSSATARYKASVAAGACAQECPGAHGGRIADLTGGLGVDSWAFAQVFREVLYNEMRPELADAAVHNFRELGVTNIQVWNCALVPSGMASADRPENGRTVSEILGPFRPDILFLDPARRAADGRKVFRLEDCQPDVLRLLPELLSACPRLLLKLSPMADITLVCNQLGCVREVHVVSADGECKELLLLLEASWAGPRTLTVVEDGAVMQVPVAGGVAGNVPCAVPDVVPGVVPGVVPDVVPGAVIQVPVAGNTPGAVMAGTLSAPPSAGDLSAPPSAGDLLFEPGKALLKAGAFDLPCTFGLSKLGRHTHLYVGAAIPEALRPFGKCFLLLEALPLDKRGMRTIGQKYPRADVTARNIPLTSDQLRVKLGVRSGGDVHIFGLHSDALHSNLLLVARRA